MKKYALFDMDGVLIDSMPFHVKAWQEAMGEAGMEVDEELLYLHEGAIEPDTAVYIFQNSGYSMTKREFEEILSRQIEIFKKKYFPFIKPYPNIDILLEELKTEGWDMAMVTSSHSSLIEDVLPASIRDFMACIITGDMVQRRKPDPGPYIEAMKRVNARPDQCTVIENAPAGIKSAKAAAARCIAIKTTLSEKYLSEADHIANNHVHLQELLLFN